MLRVALVTLFSGLLFLATASAQEAGEPEPELSAAEAEYRAKLGALDWVSGPATVKIGSNSSLELPEGYVFLDQSNTAKFEELNQNLSSGEEVMVAPDSLSWAAYLVFEGEGYVKDDDKIDAPAILKTLTDGTEASNEERERRGWAPLHIKGWQTPPAYNTANKRLEWATLLESQGHVSANFFTKILGRRGYTSVVLVASPEGTPAAISELNTVLTKYTFTKGETYADWKPGDKVAEYGLAGLIVGGAAAAAVKTGLFKGLWKILVVGAIAAAGFVKQLFGRKREA
jgi:uncharacterized membrane-anchored protein